MINHLIELFFKRDLIINILQAYMTAFSFNHSSVILNYLLFN